MNYKPLTYTLLVAATVGLSGQCVASSDLSVMTYNLRHYDHPNPPKNERTNAQTGDVWVGKRDEQVIKAIISKLPDIIGVQEMTYYPTSTKPDPREYIRLNLASYYETKKGIGNSPKDIFYNSDKFILDIKESGSDYLWPDTRSTICPGPGGEGKGRSFTWAILTHKSSKNKIFIVNAHLHHLKSHSQIRLKQIECIKNLIEEQSKDLPVVFMGDLNSRFDELPDLMTELNKQNYPLYYAGSKVEATYNGFCFNCKRDDKANKLDYIFIRKLELIDEPEVVKYSYFDDIYQVDRWPSDHYPLYAELNFVNEKEANGDSINSGFSLFW